MYCYSWIASIDEVIKQKYVEGNKFATEKKQQTDRHAHTQRTDGAFNRHIMSAFKHINLIWSWIEQISLLFFLFEFRSSAIFKYKQTCLWTHSHTHANIKQTNSRVRHSYALSVQCAFVCVHVFVHVCVCMCK